VKPMFGQVAMSLGVPTRRGSRAADLPRSNVEVVRPCADAVCRAGGLAKPRVLIRSGWASGVGLETIVRRPGTMREVAHAPLAPRRETRLAIHDHDLVLDDRADREARQRRFELATIGEYAGRIRNAGRIRDQLLVELRDVIARCDHPRAHHGTVLIERAPFE